MSRRRSTSAKPSPAQPQIRGGGAVAAPRSDLTRKVIVVLLLVFGVELGLITGWGIYFGSSRQLMLLLTHLAVPAIAIVVGLLPAVRPHVTRFLDRLRSPSPRARRWAQPRNCGRVDGLSPAHRHPPAPRIFSRWCTTSSAI